MTVRHHAIPAAVVQNTPEWLVFRKTGIGSSDAPVIAGERGSLLELWAEKCGLVEREPPDDQLAALFEWGHRLEPVVADWYQDTTGRKVRRVNRLLVHPTVPWAFASLDRVTATKGEDRIVEIKTTRRGWDAGEAVPGFVQAQVQHQLWVTGYEVADLAVLTGGSEPRVHEIVRDDEFIDNLVWLETEFWEWVTSQTRPPIDGSETTRRVLGKLHPRGNGVLIPNDPSLDRTVHDWLDAKQAAVLATERAETLANGIRTIIGDTDGIQGLVTWKKNADSARVDWVSVARSYREALSSIIAAFPVAEPYLASVAGTTDLDIIEGLYTSTVEGARVLRPVRGIGPRQPVGLSVVPEGDPA